MKWQNIADVTESKSKINNRITHRISICYCPNFHIGLSSFKRVTGIEHVCWCERNDYERSCVHVKKSPCHPPGLFIKLFNHPLTQTSHDIQPVSTNDCVHTHTIFIKQLGSVSIAVISLANNRCNCKYFDNFWPVYSETTNILKWNDEAG